MTARLLMARLLSAGVLLFAEGAATALAEDWKPIDPAHLAMKAPTVEKDADAEVIFWEARVHDDRESYRTVFNHYLRIKVFTERGKESQSKVDLGSIGDVNISDIAGRTIKPDGTIVELKKDAVFERTAVKFGSIKVKVKSFAMPGVEPGCIIDYRWKQERYLSYYKRLYFQRDIPIQTVKYFLRPLASSVKMEQSKATFASSTPGTPALSTRSSTTATLPPNGRNTSGARSRAI